MKEAMEKKRIPQVGSRKGWMVHFICLVSVLASFVLASLFLISIGVQVYKNIVSENATNYKLRSSLSYLATKVRQMDQEGCIYIEERNNTTVLVMEKKIDKATYETLLYYYHGKLYEVFHEKGAEFTLEDGGYGMDILEIDKLSMKMIGTGMLQILAENRQGDTEELILSLRSGRKNQ